MQDTFVLKGNICFSADRDHLSVFEDSFVVCEKGICRGVFSRLPEKYRGLPCREYPDRIIIPGLVDLHTHAPQNGFRGLGMDRELLEWLNAYTFPEESRYSDPEYAGRAYRIFVEELQKGATTRAVIFATAHVGATLLLMELLDEAGLCAYVGKVNMDRNCAPEICEAGAGESAKETRRWLDLCAQRGFRTVRPILTPRFIPACSDELMRELSKIQREYGLPLQSHLSENRREIAWVRELCPDARFYADAYDRYGLFGGDVPTVMAHCVHSTDEETKLLRKRGVFVAHCPQSNAALASGIAPVRRYLDMGIKVGLGTDVAAGFSLSVFRAMADAVQCSKLRWSLADDSLSPLTMAEAFYLATKGGGEFFGKTGSFEDGYEFDAVVLDDANLRHPQKLTVQERLERLVYLSDDRNVEAKYAAGRQVAGKKQAAGCCSDRAGAPAAEAVRK